MKEYIDRTRGRCFVLQIEEKEEKKNNMKEEG
jgi:hypothetical protein